MPIELRWPTTIRPASCSFKIATRTVYGASPLRKARRAFGSVVDQWTAKLSWERLPPDLWMPLDGMISRVDGPLGTIRMWDAARSHPFGMAAGLNVETAMSLGIGSPFSDGTYFTDGKGWLDVSAYGFVATSVEAGSEFLSIGGLVPNQPVSLLGGDLFEVGGYLYKAGMTAASDANGFATVTIRPRLRTTVLDGDSVLFAFPTSPFQLADDEQGAFEIVSPMDGSIGLSLVEVLP